MTALTLLSPSCQVSNTAARVAALSPAQFSALCRTLTGRDLLEAMKLRGLADPLFFTSYHWGELKHPFAPFHTQLIRTPVDGDSDVWAAFRKAGKTVSIQALVVHGIEYQLPWARYIKYFSASEDLAVQKVRGIRNALERKASLRRWFGRPFKGRPAEGMFETRWGHIVQAAGVGQSVRGAVEGVTRPTALIIDDVEDKKIALSLARRKDLQRWFEQDVVWLLEDGGVMIALGNVIHPDGLMTYLQKNPAFRSHKIPAVIKWPDGPGADALWEQCRQLFTKLEDEHRIETARTFYREHKAEMIVGGVLSWPSRHDWFEDIYLRRWTYGDAVFWPEMLCDATGAAGGAIRANRITWAEWLHDDKGGGVLVANGRGVPRSLLRTCICHDDAEGSGSGDWAASAVVGVDGVGYQYVLDELLTRDRTHSDQVKDVWSLAEKWNATYLYPLNKWMEEDFAAEQTKRRAEGKPWQIGIHRVYERDKKEARLLSLEPLLANGWLLLTKGLPEEFRAQLLAVPHGAHDDGPDAVQGCLQGMKETGIR